MANEVRFIHDALGQSTISNMATDATMKELLEAMGSGSTTRGGKGLGSLKGVFNGLETKVKSFEHGVKSTMRPFTGFISMIGKGEVRMSAFGNHLNNSVISKLPIVGGLFGGVGSVVFAGVGILETWNTASKTLAVDGATFGNSMLEFVNIAGKTRMSLSQLNSVVGQNIEQFNSLGPSTAQGVRNFSKFSDSFFTINRGASTQLLNMGYSFEDINTQMVDFLFYTQRTTNMSLEKNMSVQSSFVSYMKNLDMLTKVFSMGKDQINQASAKILKNSMYMIEMNKKNPEAQSKHAMAAQMLSAVYAESVSGVYMDQVFATGLLTGNAMDLELMLGNKVAPIARQLIEAANDPGVTEKQFESLTLDLLAESVYNSNGQLDQMKNLIATMSTNPEIHQGMYKSIQNIADFISKKDLRNKSKEDIRKMFEEAKKEQNRIDGINEIIIAFNSAIVNFRAGFQEGLTGGLEQFGLSIAEFRLPELFNQAGIKVAEFAESASDGIKRFFELMSTSRGQDYLLESAKLMFKKYGAKTYLAVKRGIVVMIREAIEAVPGGKHITGFMSALDTGIKKVFGDEMGNPFAYTEQEYSNQMNMIDASSVVRDIGNQMVLNNKGNMFAEQIKPGTIINPNYKALGMDDLGPLIWYKGRWVVMNRSNFDMNNLFDPDTYGGNWQKHARMVVDENPEKFNAQLSDGISRLLNQQGYGQSRDGRKETGTIFYNNKGVSVNAKYASTFQSVIRLLNDFGLSFDSISTQGDGKAQLILNEATHGMDWYKTLSSGQQDKLRSVMASGGLTDYYMAANTEKYVQYYLRLRDGIVSSLKDQGGVHADLQEFRTGTLESTGRLFNDFGRRTKIKLSGDKAVLTKPQFDTIKEGAAQIPMKDLVNSVNSSVQEMIRLTQMDINTSKSTLSVA